MLQGLKEGTYPEQELHWLIIYCWNSKMFLKIIIIY